MVIIKTGRLRKYNIKGITLYPFIFIDKYIKNESEEYECLLVHEKVHIRQQKKWFIIPFYIKYGIEYIINLIKYKGDTYKAYYNISFEKEAFKIEKEYRIKKGYDPR